LAVVQVSSSDADLSKFYLYNSILINSNLIISVILISSAIFSFFKFDKSTNMWKSLFVFCIFVFAEYYLSKIGLLYKKNHGLWKGEISISVFVAAFKCGVACITIFITWSVQKFIKILQ
jgi:hypothetical protein